MAIKFRDIEMPMQEALWHAVDATNEHKKIMEEHAKLNNEANTLQGLLEKQDPNSQAYLDTKKMIDNIKKEAELLAGQGISRNIRSNLYDLQGQYQNSVAPIKLAYEARMKSLAAENAAMQNDPSLIIENGGTASTSVDDWVKNPGLNFKRYSGSQLTKEVADAASKLAHKFINGQNAVELRSLVGGDYYAMIQRHGFSPEAITKAILNSPNASPVLKTLLDNAIDASGIRGWASSEQMEAMMHRAKQGLYHAIGQDSASLTANWRAQQEAKPVKKSKDDRNNFKFGEKDDLTNREYADKLRKAIEDAVEIEPGFWETTKTFLLSSPRSANVMQTQHSIDGVTNYAEQYYKLRESSREDRKQLKHLDDDQRAMLAEYGIHNYQDLIDKGFYDPETKKVDFSKIKQGTVLNRRTLTIPITDMEKTNDRILGHAARAAEGLLYEVTPFRTNTIEWEDGVLSNEFGSDAEIVSYEVPSFEKMTINGVFKPMVVLGMKSGRTVGINTEALDGGQLTNYLHQDYAHYLDAKKHNDDVGMRTAQEDAAYNISRFLTHNYNQILPNTSSEEY